MSHARELHPGRAARAPCVRPSHHNSWLLPSPSRTPSLTELPAAAWQAAPPCPAAAGLSGRHDAPPLSRAPLQGTRQRRQEGRRGQGFCVGQPVPLASLISDAVAQRGSGSAAGRRQAGQLATTPRAGHDTLHLRGLRAHAGTNAKTHLELAGPGSGQTPPLGRRDPSGRTFLGRLLCAGHVPLLPAPLKLLPQVQAGREHVAASARLNQLLLARLLVHLGRKVMGRLVLGAQRALQVKWS